MTEVITIAFALGLGYLVTVAASLTLTFGLTSASPAFVAKDGRITMKYLLVHGLIWTLCAAGGGYVAAILSGTWFPWLIGSILTGWLAWVLWTNMERRRTQAVAQQIAMTALSAAGVALGMWLRLRS